MQFLPLRRGLRVCSTLLPLSLAPGCHEPLAVQDSYFVPGSPIAAAQRVEALHAIRYNRALQAARQSCPVSRRPDAATADEPHRPTAAARRTALARLCAEMPAPSAAAHGGTGNAYRRWVEDRVRVLPESSATAAGAGGGS